MLPIYLLLISSIAPVMSIHLLLKRHIDFRQRFLERRRQREIKDQRISILDEYPKDTETLDDILHYRLTKKHSKKLRKVYDMENDFRRLIAMEGAKYNYKRDMYWRTWRRVLTDQGVEKVVCYKCNNPIVVNSTDCQNCGMWTIEEGQPPCPYEFFSVINENKLCGANYTHIKDIYNSCPAIITFAEVQASCDNPIETVWRFSKLYGTSGEYDNVICQGKDYCEILTIYEVTPQYVSFRIINSTNDVMYSRIMKPNKNNFICVDDCGRFNIYTKKVTKSDHPFKLDLLSSRISKREDVLNKLNETIQQLLLEMHAAKDKRKKAETSLSKVGAKKRKITKKKLKFRLKKRQQNILDYDNKPVNNYLVSLDGVIAKPTMSPCKKVENKYRISDEDDEDHLF